MMVVQRRAFRAQKPVGVAGAGTQVGGHAIEARELGNEQLLVKASELEKLLAEQRMMMRGGSIGESLGLPFGGGSDDELYGMVEVEVKGDFCGEFTGDDATGIGNSRGRLYEAYRRKREARLREESRSERSAKDAKMKALQERLEECAAEMRTMLPRSCNIGQGMGKACGDAEKLKEQEFQLVQEDEERHSGEIGNSQNQPVDETTSDDSRKRTTPSKNSTRSPSSPVHGKSFTSPPKSSSRPTSGAGKSRFKPEQPMNQLPPSTPDLKRKNTKPTNGSSNAIDRVQPKKYTSKRSTNDDPCLVKEEKPRRSLLMRKNSVSPVESSDLSPRKTDSSSLKSVHNDHSLEKAQKGIKPKTFLQKGGGAGLGSRNGIAKQRASPASNNKDQGLGILVDQVGGLSDMVKADKNIKDGLKGLEGASGMAMEEENIKEEELKGSESPLGLDNEEKSIKDEGLTGLESPYGMANEDNGIEVEGLKGLESSSGAAKENNDKKDESFRGMVSPSRVDKEDEEIEMLSAEEQFITENDKPELSTGPIYSVYPDSKIDVALASNIQMKSVFPSALVETALEADFSARTTEDFPEEISKVQGSPVDNSLACAQEALSVNASEPAPFSSTEVCHVQPSDPMMGDVSTPVDVNRIIRDENSPTQSAKKDVKKGLKRLLNFGRKRRGPDGLSSDKLEHEYDSEGSHGKTNQKPSEVGKSRMEISQHRSIDHGSFEGRASQSSHPSPREKLKVREDHIPGSLLKVPLSFFSLTTFRCKGS